MATRPSSRRYMTADELLRNPIPDKRTELVRGRLVVREPAGAPHGWVAAQLTGELFCFLRETPLGEVYAAETGFTLHRHPDTVRAPDVAFVTAARVPLLGTDGFGEVAPDLVVEVLSPDDRKGMVATKVGHWLGAGARLVWVIDPRKHTAVVHRADGSTTSLARDGVLDGEDVLPGFSLPLARVLPH